MILFSYCSTLVLGLEIRGKNDEQFSSQPPWGEKIFDVLKKDRSKAKGVEEIAGKLDIKRSEIICFGDGLNDIEMIEYAGLGVAMGNSKEELKEIADHITDTAENDGIYKACKKFNLL